MNADATDPCKEPGKEAGVKEHQIRTCGTCGAKFSATNENEFCPVCMLRNVLAGGVESGEFSSEDSVKPTQEDRAQRFEHYELVKGEDGTPVELGHGAMGVTYKAFDADLRCPVALKVISEKYLGDAPAQLRFLRSPLGGQCSSSKRCFGISPWENRKQLLLRDGVCGRGDTGEVHQTLAMP